MAFFIPPVKECCCGCNLKTGTKDVGKSVSTIKYGCFNGSYNYNSKAPRKALGGASSSAAASRAIHMAAGSAGSASPSGKYSGGRGSGGIPVYSGVLGGYPLHGEAGLGGVGRPTRQYKEEWGTRDCPQLLMAAAAT